MRGWFFGIVVLAGLLAPAAFGFRPLTPEGVARRRIAASEANFRVENHAELYRYTQVDRNGVARSGEMLIIYAYDEAEVRGVFRVLPREGFAGATLLYRQSLSGPGEPEIYLDDPARGIRGRLLVGQWWTRVGDTDWRAWLILDEDKNPWRYERVDHVRYRGHSVNVIQARYADLRVAAQTGVHGRRLYLDRERDLAHAVEYLDRQGNLLICLDLLEQQAFQLDGETQFRTRRLIVHNHEDNSFTALVRRATRFNSELPDALFDPRELTNWTARWDASLLSALAGATSGG